MSWMSVLKWGRPRLTEGPHIPGTLRRRDRITWQDVLRTVANCEMEVRRLHASGLYDRGMPADGTITMKLQIGPHSESKVLEVTSDPALDSIKDQVAHLVANAGFPDSGTAMVVEIDCTFESQTETGWGDDDFGGPSRGRGGFGDPF
ncbi:MAG: hypothetical protein H6737_09165 [Alphaproteobacteria bacterium]|nr:hypothetical protein [Alphaproteobacteria bacterium]